MTDKTYSFSAIFGVSRESANLTGVAVAAHRSGFAVLPVHPVNKKALCILPQSKIKAANKEAQQAAKAAGRRDWNTVLHWNSGTCGPKHVFGSEAEVKRVFDRLLGEYPDLNIGIEVGKSRVLVVDADTAEQVDTFTEWWSQEMRGALIMDGLHESVANAAALAVRSSAPTVRSPGKVNDDGEWVHKNGGHYYFRLPDGVDFSQAETGGGLEVPGGAMIYIKDRLILTPPSVRPEGPYTLDSDIHDAPPWLIDAVTLHVEGFTERRRLQSERLSARRNGEVDDIDVWSASVTWASLLEPDGWSASHKFDGCSCEIWTRPGNPGSWKSATAHEPGCARFEIEGSGWLKFWSSDVPAPLQGHSAVSKLQYVALMSFDGDTRQAMIELGIARSGGDTLSDEDIEFLAQFDRIETRHVESPAEQAYKEPSRIEEAKAKVLEAEEFPFPEVDWEKAFAEQPDDIPWLIEPILEEGRYYSLFSREKMGKSLLSLELAASIAAGRPVMGNPATSPMDVVYLDFENTEEDLVERLEDMGFTPKDLSRLHYLSFPAISALDTPTGAGQLKAIVEHYNPRIVFIDTTSRVISGEENDATPFLALYRLAIVELKKQRVTVVRLDHSGKDETKGQRGSSAKGTAEDVLWELTETGADEFRLKKTRTRNNHGPTEVCFRRLLDPLRHELVEEEGAAAVMGEVDDLTKALISKMDQLKIPASWGERKIKKAFREAGEKAGKTDRLRVAQRLRRESTEPRKTG